MKLPPELQDPSRKYPVLVKLHLDDLTQDEAEAVSGEAADAALVMLVARTPDGQRLQQPVSLDGATGKPMTSAEVWLTWAALAYDLQSREDLPSEFRKLAGLVHDIVERAQKETKLWTPQ